MATTDTTTLLPTIGILSLGSVSDGYLNKAEENNNLTIQFKQNLSSSNAASPYNMIKISLLDQNNNLVFDQAGKAVEVIVNYVSPDKNPNPRADVVYTANFTSSQLKGLIDASGYHFGFSLAKSTNGNPLAKDWITVKTTTDTAFTVDTNIKDLGVGADNQLFGDRYLVHSGAEYGLQKGMFTTSTGDADIVKIKLSVQGYADKIINADVGKSLSGFSINLIDSNGYNFKPNQDGMIKATITDRAGNTKDIVYNFHIQDKAVAPLAISVDGSNVLDGYLNKAEAGSGLSMNLHFQGNQMDAYGLKADPFNKVSIDLYGPTGYIKTFQSTLLSTGTEYKLDTNIFADSADNQYLSGLKDGTYTLKYSLSNGTETKYLQGFDTQFKVDQTINDFSINNPSMNQHIYVDANTGAAQGTFTAQAADLQDIVQVTLSANGITKVITPDAGSSFISKLDLKLMSDLGFTYGQDGTITAHLVDKAGNTLDTSYTVHIQDQAAAPVAVALNGSNILDGYLNQAEAASGLTMQLNYEGNQVESGYLLKANPFDSVSIELYGKDGLIKTFDTKLVSDGTNYKLDSTIFKDLVDSKYLSGLKDGDYSLKYSLSNGTETKYLQGFDTQFKVDQTINDFSINNPSMNQHIYVDANTGAAQGTFTAQAADLQDIVQVTLSANGITKVITPDAGSSFISKLDLKLMSDLGFTYGQDGTITAHLVDKAGNTLDTSYTVHIQDQAAAPVAVALNGSNILDGYLNQAEAASGLTMQLNYEGNQVESGYLLKANPFDRVSIDLYGKDGLIKTFDTKLVSDDTNYKLDSTIFKDLVDSKYLSGLKDGDYALKYSLSNGTETKYLQGFDTQFKVDQTIKDFAVSNQSMNQHFFVDANRGDGQGQFSALAPDLQDIVQVTLSANGITKIITPSATSSSLSDSNSSNNDSLTAPITDEVISGANLVDGALSTTQVAGAGALSAPLQTDTVVNVSDVAQINAALSTTQVAGTGTLSAPIQTDTMVNVSAVAQSGGGAFVTKLDLKLMSDLGFTYGQDGTITAHLIDKAGNTLDTSYTVHIQDQAAAPVAVALNGSNILDGYLNQAEAASGLTMQLNYEGNQVESGYLLKANPFDSVSIELYGKDGLIKTFDTKLVSDGTNYKLDSTIFKDLVDSKYLSGLKDGDYSLKYSLSNGTETKYLQGFDTQFKVDQTINDFSINNPSMNQHIYVDANTGAAQGTFTAQAADLQDIVQVTLSANGITKVITPDAGSSFISKLDLKLMSDLGFTYGQDGTITAHLVDKAGNTLDTSYTVHIQDQAAAPVAVALNGSNILDGYLNQAEAASGLTMQLNYEGNQVESGYLLKANPFDRVSIDLYGKDGLIKTFDTKLVSDGTNYKLDSTIFKDLADSKYLSGLKDGDYALKYSLSNGTETKYLQGFDTQFKVDQTIDGPGISSSFVSMENTSISKGILIGTLNGQTDILNNEVKIISGDKEVVVKATGDQFKVDLVKDLGFNPGETKALQIQMSDVAGNVYNSPTPLNVHLQGQAVAPSSLHINGVNSLSVSDHYINSLDSLSGLVMNAQYQGNQSDAYGLLANPFNHVKVDLMDSISQVIKASFETTIANSSSGTYAFNAPVFDQAKIASLADGSYALKYSVSNDGIDWRAVVADDSGSFANQFVLDRQVAHAEINPSYFYNNGTPNISSDDFYLISNKVLSGTFDDHDWSSLSLSINGNSIAPSISGNTWTLNNFDNLIAGQKYTLNVTTTDNAGNSVTDLFQVSVLKQLAAPVITSASVQTINNRDYVGQIQGTAEASSKVEFYTLDANGNHINSQSIIADASGKWSITPSGLSDSSTAQTFYINALGNTETTRSLVVVGSTNGDTLDTSLSTTNNSVLYGFKGSDSLTGGAGNDWIFGGAASDTLIGGGGADKLIGGPASDTYKYLSVTDSSLNSRDTIMSSSFSTNQSDKIDLSALLKEASLTGNFVATNGTVDASGSSATQSLGTFWLHDSTLYGNISGNQAADFAVTLASDAGVLYTHTETIGLEASFQHNGVLIF